MLSDNLVLRDLTASSFDRHYYEEHKRAKLDYLGFGEWQQAYGRWLVESLDLFGKRLLDVGCACGSVMRGLGQAGARVQGIDLCEYMIQLGRQEWPEIASRLFVCDAINLHLFRGGTFHALHSAQVAEHWRPQLVPLILQEMARVVEPGGLLFCCLDTEELFARQGRLMENEDPTHVCIRPMSWWHNQLKEAGWKVCTSEYAEALRDHPESFLSLYDWEWIVARRTD